MTDSAVHSGRKLEPTSTTLLEHLRVRDRAGWQRFVHVYGPLIYGWCRRAGLQESDAADIGQEVFQAVARNIHGYRPDGKPGAFRRWLRAVTRHKICDRIRRAQDDPVALGGSTVQYRLLRVPEPNAFPEDDDPATAATEDCLVARRAMDLVLTEFSDVDNQAFLAVVIHGRSPAEVAESLNVTVNVVYLARSRIMKRLRSEFGDLIDL